METSSVDDCDLRCTSCKHECGDRNTNRTPQDQHKGVIRVYFEQINHYQCSMCKCCFEISDCEVPKVLACPSCGGFMPVISVDE